MTGTASLAEEFTGVIKGHFTLTEEGGPKTHDNGKLRLIQVLFPEHCETDPGKKPQWVTPARQGDIAGPTIEQRRSIRTLLVHTPIF